MNISKRKLTALLALLISTSLVEQASASHNTIHFRGAIVEAAQCLPATPSRNAQPSLAVVCGRDQLASRVTTQLDSHLTVWSQPEHGEQGITLHEMEHADSGDHLITLSYF